jgi:hypothetical protein
LLVGLLLMAFIVIAPAGVLGLLRRPLGGMRKKAFRVFSPKGVQ